MLPYDLSQKQARNFITGFDVKNDKIKIRYANKNTEVKEYTKVLEDHLLYQMENQINTYGDFESKIFPLLLEKLIISFLVTLTTATAFFPNSQMKQSLILGCGSFLASQECIKLAIKYFDLKKNKKFLNNKNILTKYYNNPEIVNKLNIVLAHKINKLVANDELLNINNLDIFTYREIVALIRSIQETFYSSNNNYSRKLKQDF